ncbi:reverse transcriptase domain-containing protein [Tanacetum coccineum]
MPFGLCNAPAIFQRCMLAIFHDMIEESVEVFMDNFSVFENSIDTCLNNLDKMLQRCKDAHLVLNWKKFHLMVKEGIVLGHKVSRIGLEVDKAKIDVISKHPSPTNIKEFDIEIKDKKGTENVVADHLSRIENDETSDDSEVDDNFPRETLMEINTKDEPWYFNLKILKIMKYAQDSSTTAMHFSMPREVSLSFNAPYFISIISYHIKRNFQLKCGGEQNRKN